MASCLTSPARHDRGLACDSATESIGHAISFLSAYPAVCGYTVAFRKALLDGLHATAIACVSSLIVYIPIYLALFIIRRFLQRLARARLAWSLSRRFLTGVRVARLFGRAWPAAGASAAGAFLALGPGVATCSPSRS